MNNTNRIYYECPTQVKFYDLATEDYIGGIAFHEYIICGCCGGLLEIADVIDECTKMAPDITNPIISYENNWVDISEYIKD